MKIKQLITAKNKNSLRIVLIVFLVICLFIVFAVFFYGTNRTLSKETEKNLKKSVDLSRDSLYTLISTTFEHLEMTAQLCDNPEESDPAKSNWYQMVSSNRTEGYRMGVANAHGIIYYADGKKNNIASNSSYRKLLSGEKVISSVEEKDMGGKDALVLGVPIFDKRNVVGAVCAEYTSAALGNLVNTRETKGVGATLVFQKNGSLVASYPGMENYDTIYDMLETMTFERGATVSEMKAIVQKDGNGIIHYNNHGQERLLYYTPVGMEDWYIVSIVDANGFGGTVQEINRNAIILVVLSAIIFIFILLIFSRILSARRTELEELQRDPLTGVWNRKWAESKVQESWKKSANSSFYNCCMFLDVDDFKTINDTMGHLEGDQSLRHLSLLLKGSLREIDIVSRYGGDEFCLWLWDIAKKEDALKIAENLLNKIREDGRVKISMGITMFQEEDSCESMVKRADTALYIAKEKGKNQAVIF